MFESDHDLFDSSLDEAEVRAGCENVDTLNSMERLGITDHNKPQEVVKQSAGQIGVKSETCGGKSETCDAKSEVCGSLNASILCCKSDICTDMCVTCKEIITEREKALQLSKVQMTVQHVDSGKLTTTVSRMASVSVLTDSLKSVAGFTGMTHSGLRPARVSGLFRTEVPSALATSNNVPESESLMDLSNGSNNNEVVPDSDTSSQLNFQEFVAGLQDIDSQAQCTQLASGGPRNYEESLAMDITVKKEVVDTNLQVVEHDPNKFLDIVTGVYIAKTSAHGPANDGFGSSLGKFLFEARENTDPPVQIVFEGPVASGKSTLMSMLCALLRGEGKPTFLYDENMLDCVANDQSFDLTELSNEFPAVYGLQSELAWLASMFKRSRMYSEKKMVGVHAQERSPHSAMFVFVEAMFRRNLMSVHSYTAFKMMYEQVVAAQNCDPLITTIVVFLMPGMELCRKRALSRSNKYDTKLSEEMQTSQYNLHEDLIEFYRNCGLEVAIVYGPVSGVRAQVLLGELYAYICLRTKMTQFYSEPTPNQDRFKVLTFLPPLAVRSARCESLRTSKMPKLENVLNPPAPVLVDTEDEEDDFDGIRRELRVATVYGDKPKIFKLCKEALTSLIALGYTGDEKEAPHRVISKEFPHSMSTSKKRKRDDPEGHPFGEPFNTSSHNNSEVYMQLTGRFDKQCSDGNFVLVDAGGWASEALAKVTICSKVGAVSQSNTPIDANEEDVDESEGEEPHDETMDAIVPSDVKVEVAAQDSADSATAATKDNDATATAATKDNSTTANDSSTAVDQSVQDYIKPSSSAPKPISKDSGNKLCKNKCKSDRPGGLPKPDFSLPSASQVADADNEDVMIVGETIPGTAHKPFVATPAIKRELGERSPPSPTIGERVKLKRRS